MRKKKRRLYTLLAVVSLMVVGLFLWLSKGGTLPSEPCRGVEISISTPDNAPLFMDEAMLYKELQSMKLKITGEPLDRIDVHKIEQLLRKNPMFDKANVYLSETTAKLHIKIKQRIPLFLVEPNDHSGYYVATDRSIIPINAGIAPYVPLISGEVSTDEAKTKVFDLIQTLSADDYFRNYFTQIYLDPVRGLILTPRIGRTTVYLGDFDKIEEKLHKLRIFNQQVVSRKGWDAFEYVKLSFSGQVVAKERYPKPPPKDKEGDDGVESFD